MVGFARCARSTHPTMAMSAAAFTVEPTMDFALPELGEGVYEAELVRWLVKPGDTVKRGQPLLEVMTDKATMEVPAPFAAKITAVNGEPGAKLKVGEPILSYQGDARSEA